MYADLNSSLLTRSILSHSMTSGSCFRKTSDDLLCGPARTKVGSPTAFRSSSALLNSTLLTLLIDFTHADLKDLNVRTVPGVLAIAAATEVGVSCSLTGVVGCLHWDVSKFLSIQAASRLSIPIWCAGGAGGDPSSKFSMIDVSAWMGAAKRMIRSHFFD